MADTKGWIDVIRRVAHQDDDGVLEVGPGDAGLGVEIRCPDQRSVDYWGDIRFTLRPEMARLLGQALIAAASEAEANDHG